MSEDYRDWAAVMAAMKAAAAKNVKDGRAHSVAEQLTMARFDRFLSRVFAAGEESEWLLKGGTSMLARVSRTRTTKDVDLAAEATDLDEAIEALRETASRDLGDHVRFEISSVKEAGGKDQQPGVATRRVTFACLDAHTGRLLGHVPVDVAVGTPPIGTVETVEPATRLRLNKALASHPYRLFPLADHIADKVTATLATNYPGGNRSSRVKDLVDLVVIAKTQHVDLAELSQAITHKQRHTGAAAAEAFTVPGDWAKAYRTLAAATPAADGLVDIDEATDLVSQMVNPAMTRDVPAAATWIPGAGWSTNPSETDPRPDNDGPTNGDVHVTAHVRTGRPVREHFRSARGHRPDGV